MSSGVTVDTSDFERLGRDFLLSSSRMVEDAEPIMERGAVNLKKSMAAQFSKSPHFKRVARSVSYDRRGFMNRIAFEIGPTIGGGGSLAGVAVEGGANGGGGSVNVDHLLEPEINEIEKHILSKLGGTL